MKTKITILFCLLSQIAFSQSIVKTSIDNGGESSFANGVSIIYSIGEVNVQEVTAGNISISEGFISPGIFSSGIYIPDANFEQALINQGKDTDGVINQQISRADAEAVNILNVYSENIADLTGIEGFINLRGLDCSDNQLTELDLSNNTQLTHLNCHSNDIKVLNLINLIDLVQIYCYYNEIYTLDVSSMPNLERLYCYSNKLGAEDPEDPTTPQLLDVSNNLELQELMCHNNELPSLDVSNNTKLTRLECFANNLEELDVTNNPDIHWIRCGVNPFTILPELDLSNQHNLRKVECDFTNLEHIDMRNGNNQYVTIFIATNNPKLSCISVDDELADHSIWQVGPHPEFIFSNDCGYNTQRGQDIVVLPVDIATETSLVEVKFDDVTNSGNTTLEINNEIEDPGGFTFPDDVIVFNLETTAEFSGSIILVIDYSELGFESEEGLSLLHYEDGIWKDVTTMVDVANDKIYGEVLSLSPFVIVDDIQPPEIVNITAPADPVALGNPVSVIATFDEDYLHSAMINWGDDSDIVQGIVEGQTVSWNYIYPLTGVYTVNIQLTDKIGNVTDGFYQYIVIYDQSGGFVTGGGWIDSPEGAYVDDPTLTGKANFGFVSKYKKGSNVPTGNTEFQFKAGDLNFNSDVYEWLVIAGPQAKFKGDGQINGLGTFGFMVSAIDGQVNGGGDIDKFRIKIWDKSSIDEPVVYDNLPDADDDASPISILGGGSITIHDGKGNARIGDEFATLETLSDDQIIIYPNPVRNILTIEFPGMAEYESLEFYLLDIVGKRMAIENKIAFSNNVVEIDIADSPAGMYILLIENESGALKYKITKL